MHVSGEVSSKTVQDKGHAWYAPVALPFCRSKSFSAMHVLGCAVTAALDQMESIKV
jgi:hypothetical protein